jgi:hypothetical protein
MIATPRNTAPKGTYSPSKPPMRPGSEDFLKCPSLILGTRRVNPLHQDQGSNHQGSTS